MVLDFEKLENSFRRQGKPYWHLFEGRSKSSKPIESNMTNENLDESWGLLSSALDDFGDGVYCIELRSSPNSGRGNPQLTFSVGMVEDVAPAQSRERERSGGFARGNDFQLMQMLFPYMSSQISGVSSTAENLRQENMKLQLQLAEIKNEAAIAKVLQESSTTPDNFDRFLQLIETPAGGRLLDRVTGSSEARAAIGTVRAAQGASVPAKPKTEPAPTQTQPEPNDDPEADWDLFDADADISIDHMINVAYRMKKALPELNLNAVFEKIAQKAENEPETVRNLINFL